MSCPRSLVDSLPKPNYDLLKYLCKFLIDVSLNEGKPKQNGNVILTFDLKVSR